MKTERQAAMLRLIRENTISTQKELADRLEAEGFSVTQATVSRDIRTMGITKVSEGGKVHYVSYAKAEEGADKKHVRVLKDAVLSAELAGNIVVVRTSPGMAMAAAAVLDDQSWEEIVGCIAGDNTIFCAVASGEMGLELLHKLEKIIQTDQG